MITIPPTEAQYDEFGKPLHPVAAAIHNAAYQAGSGPMQDVGSRMNLPAPVAQANSTVPQQIQTAPVQQMNKPDFSPVNLPAPTPTSNQQAISALKPPTQSDPQYKNSKLRNVFNAIAAGFTGAANPQAGIALGRELHDSKYNQAKSAYDTQLRKLTGQEKIEESGRNEQIEKARIGVQRGSAQLKEEQQAEVNRIRQEAQDTAAKREADYKTNLDSANKQREEHEKQLAELTREKKQRNDALAAIMNENDPVKKKALQDQYNSTFYRPQQETEFNSPEMAAKRQKAINEENARTGGLAAAAHAEGTAVGGGTPAAVEGTRAHSAASASGRLDGYSTDKAIDQQAEIAHARSWNTATANEKDTLRKAQVALQAFPDVYKQASAASDDLFANRWQDFATKVLGKQSSKEYGALGANVELLQSLVTQVHIGNRGVSSILKKFEDIFNVKQMDRDTFLTRIHEVEKWMKRYATIPKVEGKVSPDIDQSDVDKDINSSGPLKDSEFGNIEVH